MSTPPVQGRLLSIQLGKIQSHVMSAPVDGRNASWTSAIFKSPAPGPVRLSPGGSLPGDEQHDLVNHGGPDNVVLAYDADHYPVWRRRLNLPDLAHGSFGENFTVAGFSDDTVCIGDTWQLGEALLQVTQARQPCFKLARRLGVPEIVRQVKENSWGGWYLRVLREGIAEPGMTITLIARHYPEWTVARAVQTMYARKRSPEAARALAALPELSARWKSELIGEV